ncbi:MAG: DUF3784 domain-containing protein [Lactobacillus sp.]|jgi:hypothetical protein|nr:DUF3784 domain-containing protein [Lactobacillus sp.]
MMNGKWLAGIVIAVAELLIVVYGFFLRKGKGLSWLAGYDPKEYSKAQNQWAGRVTGNYMFIFAASMLMLFWITLTTRKIGLILSALLFVVLTMLIFLIYVNYKMDHFK